MLETDEFYSENSRKFQRQNDSEALANAMATAIVSDELSEDRAAFIASRDFFFLASVNAKGEPTVSYKGGAPGFVRVMGPKTLVFPNYDGNGMFLSMGNLDETRSIGLLFMDFETPHRLRVQGQASVSDDPNRLEMFPGANLVVDVEVTACFVNCARYIHKHTRVDTSHYVPDAEGRQPYPSWKRIDGFQPVLPRKDQGRAEDHGGAITADDYAALLAKGQS
ncbi:MAG: pyridoxamine 5'-phosphate oxidase family protein [Pseudomonadota bacterium]